jgi:hypothetical protein
MTIDVNGNDSKQLASINIRCEPGSNAHDTIFTKLEKSDFSRISTNAGMKIDFNEEHELNALISEMCDFGWNETDSRCLQSINDE